jgi:hypothetical protein
VEIATLHDLGLQQTINDGEVALPMLASWVLEIGVDDLEGASESPLTMHGNLHLTSAP